MYPEFYISSETVDSIKYTNIPATVNGMLYPDFIASLENCLESKGTIYYNKLAAGVKCSNIELVKLELVLYLLKQYSTFTISGGKFVLNFAGGQCVYNGSPVQGVSYGQQLLRSEKPAGYETQLFGSETYLATFIAYAADFCKDCIVSTPITTTTPISTTTGKALAEDGVTLIYLEDGVTTITL